MSPWPTPSLDIPSDPRYFPALRVPRYVLTPTASPVHAMSRLLLIGLLALCSSNGLAGSPWSRWSPASPTHTVSLAIALSSFDYQEELKPPGKSTENGLLIGFALGYEFEGGRSLPLWGRAQWDVSPSGTQYGSTETDIFGRSTDYAENISDEGRTISWFRCPAVL